MKAIVGLVLLLGMGSAGAQIYKWTDSKGVVHYSDTPVAGKDAASVHTGPASAAPVSVTLPYELASAARNHPVTLYTTGGCAGCDAGRALLKARGIPFVEKTVESDADEAKLREAGSNGELPLLLVGRTHLTGFDSAKWESALNAASYPRRSLLPKSYRFQVASAADPLVVPQPVAAEPAAEPKRKDKPPARKRERDDLPPGFQF